MTNSKITDVPEEGILQRLFSDPIPGLTIIPRLGLSPNSPIRFSVSSPFIPAFGTKPGDIDGLGLLDPLVGTAVAIEAKRLKIKPEAFSTGLINKLPGLVKGAQQANSLLASVSHGPYWLSLPLPIAVIKPTLVRFFVSHPLNLMPSSGRLWTISP